MVRLWKRAARSTSAGASSSMSVKSIASRSRKAGADQDPAAYLSDLLKPKPRVRHMARVGLQELPALVRAIDSYDGEENPRRRTVTRAALLFTLLTWARTNETRLARWDEFEQLDRPEPLWRVPAARMKMEREHLVPLSRQVVSLLSDVRAYSMGDYVFGGDKLGQPISQNTMIWGATAWDIVVDRRSTASAVWPPLGPTRPSVIAPIGSRWHLPISTVMTSAAPITARCTCHRAGACSRIGPITCSAA
jgi:integrase